MVGIVVGIAFAMGKRHSVVGRDHHNRIFKLSALFQLGEHAAKVKIEIFHLERVIEHVVANLLGIGPARWNAINIRRLRAAFGHARSIFVAAMRLVAAIPEGPWLAFWGGVEEVIEIPRVISR